MDRMRIVGLVQAQGLPRPMVDLARQAQIGARDPTGYAKPAGASKKINYRDRPHTTRLLIQFTHYGARRAGCTAKVETLSAGGISPRVQLRAGRAGASGPPTPVASLDYHILRSKRAPAQQIVV